MPVPDYRSMMLPMLRFLAQDRKEHSIAELEDAVAQELHLTGEDRRLKLTGGMRTVRSRINWAKFYLDRAGLVDTPRTGFVSITDRGRGVLSSGVSKIDNRFLLQFPEFQSFLKRPKKGKDASGRESASDVEEQEVPGVTPSEALQNAYTQVQAAIEAEVLEFARKASSERFEDIVLELLKTLGYGKGVENASLRTGGSGDEGIDGVIQEDTLGFDAVYIQAKRWKDGNNVPGKEIQAFVGALDVKNARKGVFITTSLFTPAAKSAAEKTSKKVVLIDGERLAKLMVEHNVGVSTKRTLHIKEVDSDFFEDE